MVDSAFSIEQNEEISARCAQEKSHLGQLTDKRKFLCNGCGVKLTCINWGKNPSNIKRCYFTPTDRNVLHYLDCPKIDSVERKSQIKKESDMATNLIQTGNEINMCVSKEKAISNIIDESINSSMMNVTRSKNTQINSPTKTSKKANLYSLASFVELYDNPKIQNESTIINVSGEKMTLNELFKEANDLNNSSSKSIHIFYGTGKLEKMSKNNEILMIKSDDFPKTIFANLKLVERLNANLIKKYLGTGERVNVYFRGRYDMNDEHPYKPFHDGKVYMDVYFTNM
ncbi:conserved hypothetical protein [Weissella viridescens]|nr:conserved hypothetical protein [Weissella viridescens]